MIKERITKEESIFLKNKYNKELLKFLFFGSVYLFLFSLPIYLLVFMIILLIFNKNIEFFNIYFFIILLITLFIFLYNKIIIIKKIDKRKIYKVKSEFVINSKEKKSITSENASDTDYYKLDIINNENIRKRMYVEKRDFYRLKVGDEIMVIYFDVVNILAEASYKNEILRNATF